MAIANGPLTNIGTFRQVIRDISRPYMFMVRIPFLGTDYQTTCFARSASLPGVSLGRVEVPFQSQPMRLAGATNFEGTWNVTFLCDEAHTIRKRFLNWMNLAYNPSTLTHGHTFEYKADNVQVHQLNRLGNSIAFYNFIGMYVENVGQIEVAHENSTEPEKFEVTFAYDYWTLDTQNPMGAQFIGRGAGSNVGINVNLGGGGVNIGVSI